MQVECHEKVVEIDSYIKVGTLVKTKMLSFYNEISNCNGIHSFDGRLGKDSGVPCSDPQSNLRQRSGCSRCRGKIGGNYDDVSLLVRFCSYYPALITAK